MLEMIRNIYKEINKDILVLLFLYGVLIRLEDGIAAIFRFVALQLAQRTWKSAAIVCCICVGVGVTIYKLAELLLVFVFFLALRLLTTVCATGYVIQEGIIPGGKELVEIVVFGMGSKDYWAFGNASIGCLAVMIALAWWQRFQLTAPLGVSDNSAADRFARMAKKLCRSRSAIRRISRQASVCSVAVAADDDVTSPPTANVESGLPETLPEECLPPEPEVHTECCPTCTFLMEELHREIESKLCVICQNAPKGVILLPCAHVCVCTACRMSLLNSACTCPICRNAINDSMQVYL